MKLLWLSLALFMSCTHAEEHMNLSKGQITSLRIDDDSEYHFSTDNTVESDVYKWNVSIQRIDIQKPILYKVMFRCRGNCWNHPREWTEYGPDTYWRITLPLNYKIETFED